MSTFLEQNAKWNPVKLDPVTRDIQPNDTVAGNLNNLLDAENPYIKRARKQGTEYAHSRGMLNSSMAAGAAEGAAIDRALPIAQQDAQTHFNQGQTNQQVQNNTNQFNAQNDNSALEFAARAKTDAYTRAINDAARRGQIRLEESLQGAQERTKQTAGLYAQWLSAAGDINTSDMALGDKKNQISSLKSGMVQGTNIISDMHRDTFNPVNLEGSVANEGQYIQQLFSSVDAAFANL